MAATKRPSTTAPCSKTRAAPERERDVLRLLARGRTNPQIAQALVISRKTVEHHLGHIYAKLGVSCRTSAVACAIQEQML